MKQGYYERTKITLKSYHGSGFQSSNIYESYLSNEVLYTLVGQEDANISEVKVGGA